MIPLVLLIIVFAVYWPSLKGHFVSDDFVVISNPNLQAGSYGMGTYTDRHLSWWSLVRDFKRHDVEALKRQAPPYWFHITNVLIHFACCLVVLGILHTIPGANPLAAFLFAVHPLCTGSVAYITGRFSLLSTLFGLISILGVLHGWPLLFLLGWWLACLSKPDMYTLPILAAILGGWYYLLAYALLGVPYLRHWLRTRKIEMAAIAGMPVKNFDSGQLRFGSDICLPRLEYFLTYICETIKWFPQWMFGLRLRIMPDVQKRAMWKLLMALFCMFLLLGFLLVLPMGLLKVGLALLLMSPWIFYSLIPLPHVIFEYRTYMNISGMIILLSILPTPALLLLGMLWFPLTYLRSRYWNNTMALWGTAFNEGSRSAYVLLHLGAAFLMYGRIADAETFIIEGLRKQPGNRVGQNDLLRITQLKLKLLGEK